MAEAVEIERRFLLKGLPAGLKTEQGIAIRQGCFATSPGAPLHRLRQKDSRYYYTVKTGSGLVRSETECELSREEFLIFWPRAEGKRLVKTRYEIPL